jgi:hypothetical protein
MQTRRDLLLTSLLAGLPFDATSAVSLVFRWFGQTNTGRSDSSRRLVHKDRSAPLIEYLRADEQPTKVS